MPRKTLKRRIPADLIDADVQLFNRGQFDAPVFRVRKSLGLIWVIEDATIPDEEAGDYVEHGPFVDLADAYIQCGRPANWKVEFKD